MKHIKRRYMSQLLYIINEFPYFAMHVVMMDLFKLWRSYIYIIIILTFYLCLLYLKLPWKKFLPFALGIVLDFITICYYKNASEHIFKAIGWFYSFFFFFFLRGCFEVSCVHICNANCTNNFLSPIWNILYLCNISLFTI